MIKKAFSQVRVDLDQHAEEIRAELARTSEVLTVTLIAVAVVATFALLYAVARDSHG